MRTTSLKFSSLREANLRRLPLFKNARGETAHSQPDGSDWSDSDWLMAVTGELGEFANLRKKVLRGDLSMEDAKQDLADELADVVIYLDILAYRLGIDLDEAIVSKFNRVSERVGCDVKLHYPMDASAQTVKVLFTRGGSMVWADCFHAAEEALKNEVGKLTCLVGCHDPESIADLFCRLCRGRPVQRIGTEPPTHLRYTGSTLLPDGSVPQS